MIVHTLRIRVRYADTDKMGVVHHARYLEWFECGRTELMRHLGYPYAQMEAEGYTLPVIEAWCQYLRPVFYDDLVSIRTYLKEKPRAKIRLEYEVFREGDPEMVARGFTVHSFVGQGNRPVRAPRKFLEVISPFFEHPK